MPIKVRMSVAAVLVTGLLVGALYAVVLVLIRQEAVDEAQLHASRAAQRLVFDAEADKLSSPLITSSQDELAQILGRRGQVVKASATIVGEPPIPATLPAPQELRSDSSVCGYPRPDSPCLLATAHRFFLEDKPFIAIAATPEPGLLPRPMWALLFGIVAIVALILRGVSMWWAVGRTLAPVEAIRAEMDRIITATDLHRRVPLPGRRDEIQRLAMSVNATLDRLERAVEQQRRFVSDVSHELRSPIAGLRTGLEAAALLPDEIDRDEVVESALTATERLENIVADLLVLARRDAGIPDRTEPVDLAALVRQEADRRPRRVPVTVTADPRVMVEASTLGIGRVLTNLLDNGARHARTAVQVRVFRDGEDAVVSVHDDGHGVPADSRERVFERFVRLDEGRRRDPRGSGLGLAISREIVRDHHGSLTIIDSLVGACFVLRLPAAESATAHRPA
ncbi:sensor histidine kinase [Nonomuraea dietziae]|uniref:sensor histidine kinase n=1 Tax=Nonomuraea dietziae TaxID=65515 RepID=UPI00342A6E81